MSATTSELSLPRLATLPHFKHLSELFALPLYPWVGQTQYLYSTKTSLTFCNPRSRTIHSPTSTTYQSEDRPRVTSCRQEKRSEYHKIPAFVALYGNISKI